MRILYFSAALAAIVLAISCSSMKKNRETDPCTAVQITLDSAAILQELSHFPEPQKGFARFVIFPGTDVREESRIEIIPGKTMMVDCNRHSLTGSISEKILEGWGYTYYEFASEGHVISTKMACPDFTPTEKFISGETVMVSNIPKLPVVIYVPKGIEVKYRIWTSDDLQPAQVK